MIPRTAIIPILVICIALALALFAWWQKERADKAETRAGEAESLVAGYVEAAKIRAKQDANLDRLRVDAAKLDSDLQSMEGGDAPLSDYLGSAAGRLWP